MASAVTIRPPAAAGSPSRAPCRSARRVPAPSITATGPPRRGRPGPASATVRAGGDSAEAPSGTGPGRAMRAEAHHLGLRHGAGEFARRSRSPGPARVPRACRICSMRAVLHDGDAVGKPDRLVEIMGDEDDGLLQHATAGAGTRPASRAGSADRAPRTARRGTRAPARPRASGRCRRAAAGRRKAGAGKAPSRPARPTSAIISRARASRAVAVHALHLEREGHVVEHGEMRQQREVLEHHAHLVAPDLDHLAPRRRRAGLGR